MHHCNNIFIMNNIRYDDLLLQSKTILFQTIFTTTICYYSKV